MATKFSRTADKTEHARAMRQTVSKSEARLWLYLRKNALGVSFRRQHPIGPYFADYYCAPLKLVVEVDGDRHDAEHDAHRDAFMATEGIMVLRFTSEEAFAGTEGVIEAIKNAIRERKWMLDNPDAINSSP